MSSDSKDTNLILTRFSLLLVIYSIGISISPTSYLPSAVFALGMASTLYKTRSFDWIVKRFIKTDMTSERQQLVDAIVSLNRYKEASLAWNNHKIRNLRRIHRADYEEAKAIGYYDHLQNTEIAINDNAKVASRIAQEATLTNEITELELRGGFIKDNSKAIESICHFARDWTELGDPELKPLLDYINRSIDEILPTNEDRAKTLVVVPGSGLGRIAHELATIKPSFKSVESVEFSSLMYLCNQFIYTDGAKEDFKLHPYVHTYSHHVSNETHLRYTTLSRHLQKPENLKINFTDFRTFEVDDFEQFDNVLIVTAFFLDTAQNLFEYFRGIERLIGDKKGFWINIGPLKYGTAPKVEFSLEELRKLRKLRGWKDLDEPKPYGSEISGYLTDTKGLWQGYYGLGRWTSTFNESS